MGSSHHQWVILIIVSISTFCMHATFSCVVPFFPTEAKSKALSTTEIGFLIGTPQLVITFLAPFLGRSVQHIGQVRLFKIGLLLCGASIVALGCLSFIFSGELFFYAVFCAFLVIKFAYSACTVSSMAIIAEMFIAFIMISLALLCWASTPLCTSFYDASLGEHLHKINDSPYLLGVLLSISAFVYSIMGPFLGILVDRIRHLDAMIMAIGTAMAMAFALLIGPSPLINFIKLDVPLLFIVFVIQGLSLSSVHTPTMKHCIEAANVHYDFGEISAVSGAISGLTQSSHSIGTFIGDTFGGLSVQWIGFEWTGTIAALVQLPIICGIFALRSYRYARKRLDTDDTDIEEDDQRQSI